MGAGIEMRAARLPSIALALVLAAGCAASEPTAGGASPGTPTAPPAGTVSPAGTAAPTVGPTPSASTLGSASVDAAVAFIEDLASRGELSGSALIARGDEPVWQLASGMADRDRDLPNLTDTRFNLGSMNKMFTAVAILQLMERGRLAVDDTISARLPDYPNPEVARAVTIHQLLTHTSGLGDAFTTRFEQDPHAFRSNADYLPLFAGEPLLFDPGTEWSYSNAGYVVLGLIIERVSGQTYEDYVREHVFEPAGMLDTGAFDVEAEVPRGAIGYTTQDIRGNETGVLAANTPLMPGRGFAAGGDYSTTGDMLRFRNALLAHRLLSPASTDLLITGKVDVADHVRYGYGFMDRDDAGRRVVGHTGGAPGVCSFLSIYVDTGYTVVVLSNSDAGCVAVLQDLRAHPLE